MAVNSYNSTTLSVSGQILGCTFSGRKYYTTSLGSPSIKFYQDDTLVKTISNLSIDLSTTTAQSQGSTYSRSNGYDIWTFYFDLQQLGIEANKFIVSKSNVGYDDTPMNLSCFYVPN